MPFLPLLGWLLIASTAPLHAIEKTFHYEPESMVREGILSRETFPGPPNYEDLKKGDEPETYWILNLLQPICVEVKKGVKDEFDESDMGVRRLQLLIHYDKVVPKKLGFKAGKKVRVIGMLSHAITGHHHTTVVMGIREATVLK